MSAVLPSASKFGLQRSGVSWQVGKGHRFCGVVLLLSPAWVPCRPNSGGGVWNDKPVGKELQTLAAYLRAASVLMLGSGEQLGLSQSFLGLNQNVELVLWVDHGVLWRSRLHEQPRALRLRVLV
jgi:hypothetical protein